MVNKVVSRIVAVVAGIALWICLGFVPVFWPALSFSGVIVVDIASFAVSGILLGLIWPQVGWRLGFYLFIVWPLYIVGTVAFSDPPAVIRWKDELLGLGSYLLILPGSTLGAWLGSRLRSGRSNDTTIGGATTSTHVRI